MVRFPRDQGNTGQRPRRTILNPTLPVSGLAHLPIDMPVVGGTMDGQRDSHGAVSARTQRLMRCRARIGAYTDVFDVGILGDEGEAGGRERITEHGKPVSRRLLIPFTSVH